MRSFKTVFTFLNLFLVAQLCITLTCASQAFAQISSIYVPVGGNAWVTTTTNESIQDNGLINWNSKGAIMDTYIWFDQPQEIKLYLHADVVGKTEVQVSLNGKSQKIRLESSSKGKTYVGKWKVKAEGYSKISLKGISKTAETFGLPQAWTIEGTKIESLAHFVKDNQDQYFHWGRRGPSVHLNYKSPVDTDVEWFYNEVTVPVENDVVGSFYMANGFQDGYFGMQVNSSEERRILFSVWSPFNTDDPKLIPDEKKIKLLKKGKDVYTGEFGNEGSGGQSYLKYNWKAGNTYSFLLRAQPSKDSTTTYTAYFFAPEEQNWQLIASFKRPNTNRHLQRIHSFLENFIPNQGNLERKVFFGNQWVRSVSGEWIPLYSAQFSADATARKGYRLDYQGGVENNLFYLKNGGFFDDRTEIGTPFNRSGGKQPVIQFDKLP